MSYKPPQKTHLGGHNQLVIHYVVWGVAHSKEGAGGVQVAGHPCPDIHVLPNSLGRETTDGHIRKTLLIWTANLSL